MQTARWEPLTREGRVLVTKEHGFGTDTVLLARFAAPRAGERAAELGAGCGAASLLWGLSSGEVRVDAVELQEEACGLLRRSVAENRLEERLAVHHADLRALEGVLDAGRCDLVACNPPYPPAGSGKASDDPARRMARHEETGTLREIAQAAGRLLRFGGRFCLCQRPERLCDVLLALREASLEPKRLRFVQQREGSAPNLFLAEGKKGARPGLQLLPNLIIEDRAGGYTRELEALYGSYREATECPEN